MSRPHPALLPLAAGRAPGNVPTTDDGLLASSVDHGMQGLLWTWVREHEPAYSERARLAGLDLATRERHRRLWQALEHVNVTMAAIGVGIATVKGVTAEARWYRRIGERPCTDLDVLVEPMAVQRAGEIVAELDPAHPLRDEIAELVRRGVMQSVSLHLDGVPVDLHFDLLKLGFPMRWRDLVWERTLTWRGASGPIVRVLDSEVSLVHFLVHANKDSFSWLLAYADIARVLTSEQLDWVFIERFVRAEGLDVVVTGALSTVTRALGLPSAPLTARGGLRARAWQAAWPERTTLLGSAGTDRSRRQEVVPFLVRGRFRDALRAAWSIAFPPAATVALRYPDVGGPYPWRLARGRLLTWQARRVALRARRATPPTRQSARDPMLTARLLRARAETEPLWLDVSGTSMGWSIPSGARVRVELASSPARGEVWAFCDGQGTIVVHRCRGTRNGAFVFQGDAVVHADAPIGSGQLIGRVVELAPARARYRWGPLSGVVQRVPRLVVARIVRIARRVGRSLR